MTRREQTLEKALEKAVEALQGLSKELYDIYLESSDEEETNPNLRKWRRLVNGADEALLQAKEAMAKTLGTSLGTSTKR